MNLFLWIWFGGAIIIFSGISFWTGLDSAHLKKDKDHLELLPMFFMISFVWPIVVLASPFIGLYYLGKYLGVKNAK